MPPLLPSGQTVGEAVEELAVKIGEKLEVSAAAYFDGQTAVYLHRRASDLPPQVGVLVEYEGSNESAARGAAMQIAAMRPQYVSRDEVPAELVENERRIAEATAKEEGKPEQAVPKIVEGRVNAYFKDVALLDQPSVTDNKVPLASSLTKQASRCCGSYASRRPARSSCRAGLAPNAELRASALREQLPQTEREPDG